MPKCRLVLGRRCYGGIDVLLNIGDDDFAFLETADALLRVVLIGMLSAVISHLLTNDGSCGHHMWSLLIVSITFQSVLFVVNVVSAHQMARGAIMQPKERAFGNWLIAHQLLLTPVEFGLALWGVVVAGNVDECAKPAAWLVTLVMIANGVLVLLKLIILLVVVREVAGETTLFKRAVLWVLFKMGKCVASCICSAEDQQELYTVAELLIKYARGLDLVLTDVLAGLCLIYRKHKILEGRRVILAEHQELLGDGVSGEDAGSQDDGGEAGGDATASLPDLAWASWYALGIYGWPLHVFRRAENCCFLNLMCVFPGVFSPCVDPCCARPFVDTHDDHCCSNAAALRIAMREMEAHECVVGDQTSSDHPPASSPMVVWADWANTDLETHPYAVVVDPARKAVVLTVRGTLSALDTLCDVAATEAALPQTAGGGKAHAMMYHAAEAIMQKLGERQPRDPELGGMDEVRAPVAAAAAAPTEVNGGLDDGAKRHGDVDEVEAGPGAGSGASPSSLGILTEMLERGACPQQVTVVAAKRAGARAALEGVDWSACKDYRLVVTGHSLGAGIAGVLGVLLRPLFGERLHAFPISPPGGTLSPDAAAKTDAYMTSLCFGDDVIPRLSVRTMEYLRDDMLAVLATCRLSKIEIFAEFVDTSLRSAKDLALAAMKNDSRGCCGCWRRCLWPGGWGSPPASGSASCQLAGCCAWCELSSGHHLVEAAVDAWPSGALTAWPSKHETISEEAAEMIRDHRELHPEGELTPCMEPPGRIVHIQVNSTAARALLCDAREKLGVSWVSRDQLRCIKLTPPFMLLDHLPNHVMGAVQAAAERPSTRTAPLKYSFSMERAASAHIGSETAVTVDPAAVAVALAEAPRTVGSTSDDLTTAGTK